VKVVHETDYVLVARGLHLVVGEVGEYSILLQHVDKRSCGILRSWLLVRVFLLDRSLLLLVEWLLTGWLIGLGFRIHVFVLYVVVFH
jgi:hypothetical protein